MAQQQDRDGTFRILHVAPTFFPAVYWGGTTSCNLGLCDALARLPAMELRVLTTDSAGPRLHERLAESGREVAFPAGYKVFYARRRFGISGSLELLRKLWLAVKWADVVHLTSAYSFPTIPTILACRALKKPLVWSPHGGLQRWSGSRKRMLKTAWEAVCNAIMDRRRCALHITSEIEAKESRRRVACAYAEVVPNGVEIPDVLPAREWQPGGRLRLLYIGRLDPKKGIENLVDAMMMVDGNTVLDICGTGSDAYVTTLKQRLQDSGMGDRVRFRGHVEGTAKSEAFQNADLCIVPSYTENFAMVVVEALAHAVPVIASTGTPWQELVKQDCGVWVSNEPATLAATIRDMRRRDLESMGSRGRHWMQQQFTWGSVARRMEMLYRGLVDGSRK